MPPTPSPRELRATYRLQLTPAFGFAAAAELVPYLAELGVSHLYLSPCLQARPGSTHGYDVVDPSRLSDDLGGEDGFRALVGTAHTAGLGLILDVVPNHMGAAEENRFWADPELRATFFDIDPATGAWRRFFDVDDLAAIRVEREDVFVATHARLLALVGDGLVDGLRVDHPDGLADPEAYLRRLRDAGATRVWVEKILAADERLPDSWPVSGTVGYEFLNDLTALSVNPDPAAEATFDALWRDVAADRRPFSAWAWEAKLAVATSTFTAEVDRLARIDGAPGAEAIAVALTSQPVYRSYPPPHAGEFLTRFAQTAPAVMAKGVEDTAFYRYARLIALNEVGGSPERFSLPVGAFHAHNAERALRHPEGLLTTMTHDAKRSADVRARIVALTWFPQAWDRFARRWLGVDAGTGAGTEARAEADGPDLIDRYFILQTLVGFPPTPEHRPRIDAYLVKALREAKRHSNWITPDEAYERAAQAWVAGLADDPAFGTELAALLADVEPLGAQISQAWVVLKLTCPGVPDIYQGDELTFRALVDPDNRRPVDWAARQAALTTPTPEPKLARIRELLALRARLPEAFGPAGAYQAIPAPAGTVAFCRGDRVEVTVGLAPGSVSAVKVR
ncbi:malto-oligosyltrehalose synthase [Conexibacter sp. DBS9H8]|uniref:malto-oligosyltrehalose synthase n=1 Tax=Conexibacter sp. DBS9H8 TaxID=2937801 RepID=UPI00200F435E|nr:malto-oligosyltrehalose synthase [Conexibacter sp. DBS9H8]